MTGEHSPRLPSSPAARAFFAALDAGRASQTVNTNSSFIKKRTSTLGWRNRFSQHDSYPIHVGTSKFSVTQVQRGEVEGTFGTGATVWPAAIVMIKYLERHNDLIKSKVVVDLGSGTGVTSIACAVLGASHVICTDGDLNVVQLARENIQGAQQQLHDSIQPGISSYQTNGLQSSNPTIISGCPVHVQKFWWGQDRIESNGHDVNVVIVADCVLPKLYPIGPLVDALDGLLVSPHSFAILSYEHRHYASYDPRDRFRDLAAAKGLRVTIVPLEEQDPVYSVDDIEIWRVDRNVSNE